MLLLRTTALAALALWAATAHAQKITPGLWEHAMTMKSAGGQMEAGMARMQEQMAKMSPEQRKMMEDMMAKNGVGMGAKPNTIRVCITKEQAAREEVPQHDGRCKQESMERSGNTMRFKFSCASDPPSRGEGEYTFTNDKAYTGRTVIDTTVKGKPERMEMNMTGQWVSADCGSVQPVKR